MSKDIADTNTMPQETEAAKSSLDLFNSYINAPVTKLDADEYVANDLDGSTESLIGSGNMNFLMMQAGQTNESMANANPFNMQNSDTYFSSYIPAAPQSRGPDGAETAFDRSPNSLPAMPNFADNAPTNTAATAGSLSASNFAAGSTSANPLVSTSNFASSLTSTQPPQTALNGTNGNNGTSGVNGTNGTNGNDGGEGSVGDGSNVINSYNTYNTTSTTTYNTTYNTSIIDNSHHDNSITIIGGGPGGGGDIITNIVNNVTSITNNTTNNGGDLLTTIVNNAGDIVTNITNNVTYASGDLLTTIVNNAGDIVTNTTNNVTTIINNILDGGGGTGDGSLGPIGISLDATLNGVTNLTLDVLNGGNIIHVLNETLNTAPVLDPVTSLLGDLTSSTTLDIVLNPFQYDNSPADQDLHIGTGLDLLGLQVPDLGVDVPLDLAESLVGDLDIALNLDNNLLSAPLDTIGNLLPLGGGSADTDLGLNGLGDLSPVLQGLTLITDPVEDLAGDIDIGGVVGIDLLGIGNTDQTGTDTDIHIPLDIDLVDANLLNNGLDLNLDGVENFTGDIDLDLTAAANLLGNVADPLVDNISGGTGGDGLLANLGDFVGGAVHDLAPFSGGTDNDLSLSTGIDLLDHTIATDSLSLILDPVESVTGNLDVAGDISLDLIGSSYGTPDDIDLNIGLSDFGLGNVAVNLDAVESLVGGDIDLGANITTDLTNTLLTDPMGTTGDLIGNVMTTLDHTITTATDILQSAPSAGVLDVSAITDIGSTLGLPSWTESTLPDPGNILGGASGGSIIHDIASVIPDPVIPAPIAAVLPTPVTPVVSGLGGLLGGGSHHHGGLFG